MKRLVVAHLALILVGAPIAAGAQPTPGVHRIGWLSGYALDEPFRQGLRALGYVEGQNLVIEARFHKGQPDRLPALAAELVALRVAVIVCPSTDACAAARKVTRTLPIVISGAANPLAEGLIASLARPGGNVTGATLDTAEVTAKRLELLKEALPGVRRVAAFYPEVARTFSVAVHWVRDSEAAARQLGLALELVDLGRDPGLWEPVFEGVTRRGISAAVIVEAPSYWNGRTRLAELAIKYRLAMMLPYSEFVDAGGLMSYGADIDEVHGRAAGIVDRILKGARPEDIPVELPTRFPFVVNLNTVKALGLAIPPSVLARVTRVIE